MLERARVHVQTQTTPEDLPLPTQAAKFRSLQAFAQALVDLNARFEAVLEAEVTFASFAPHVGDPRPPACSTSTCSAGAGTSTCSAGTSTCSAGT